MVERGLEQNGYGALLALVEMGEEPELAEELVDVIDAAVVVSEPSGLAVAAAAADVLEQRNLFAEGDRIAARAASPATRRQYTAIYRAFGDWLITQLGRPAVVVAAATSAQ